jgi:hypothetical protein
LRKGLGKHSVGGGTNRRRNEAVGWENLLWEESRSLDLSPGRKEGRMDVGGWCVVAKCKDGACDIFNNYEDAKGLVYRVSGAISKKYKFCEDAWKYFRPSLSSTSS